MLFWLVWNMVHFSIYWECHHPIWLSYFSEGWLNHQPVFVYHPFQSFGCVWKCCVPLFTQWFCWSLSLLNGYFIGNNRIQKNLWKIGIIGIIAMIIPYGKYTLFSDKPILSWLHREVSVNPTLGSAGAGYTFGQDISEQWLSRGRRKVGKGVPTKKYDLPSGKLSHNYGKIHHFSWENSL